MLVVSLVIALICLANVSGFISSRMTIAARSSSRRLAENPAWLNDPSVQPTKVFIKVPFDEREAAKTLGAKWDPENKSWYAFAEDQELLTRWPVKLPDDHVAPAVSLGPTRGEKFYLAVPFEAKDEAKAMGAWWDAEAKRWYAPHGEEHLIQKFGLAPPAPALAADEHGEKVYIAVPFAEKDDAKAAGARWDTDRKCWYTTDKRLLDRWEAKVWEEEKDEAAAM